MGRETKRERRERAEQEREIYVVLNGVQARNPSGAPILWKSELRTEDIMVVVLDVIGGEMEQVQERAVCLS